MTTRETRIWKARQNLHAAETLVDHAARAVATSDFRDLGNPIASRAYYATYQTVVAALEFSSVRPDHFGASSWTHGILKNACSSRSGLRDADLAILVEQARSLREKADYGPGDVAQQDAAALVRDLRPKLKEYGVET